MKQEIFIYSSEILQQFFSQLLYKYKIYFKKIEDLPKDNKSDVSGLIILNDLLPDYNIDLNKLNGNFIIISYKNINIPDKFKNLKFLKAPLKVSEILDQTNKFFSNKKVIFNDIEILNRKLTNTIKNKSCFLTEI